ncbi:hypothetical protein Tco_0833652 [Tanacetum coccineum]
MELELSAGSDSRSLLFGDSLNNLEDDLWFMKTRGETLSGKKDGNLDRLIAAKAVDFEFGRHKMPGK